MIVYLDTSAVVPLLVTEPTSDFCRRLWDDGDAVTTSRLTYVETSAALAQAERMSRIEPHERRGAMQLFERLWPEFEVIEVDDALVRRAAELTHDFALMGHDAVKCAAAEQLDDDDLVAASGDRRLIETWRKLGLSTADTVVRE